MSGNAVTGSARVNNDASMVGDDVTRYVELTVVGA